MGMRNAFYRLTRSLTGVQGDGQDGDDREISENALDRRAFSEDNNNANSFGNMFQDDEDFRLPLELMGYSSTTKNRLLTVEMGNEIRTLMPTRLQLYTDWHLVYSLEQHGASLHSLYNNIHETMLPDRRVGYVLVIRDRRQGIFGGYCNEPWLPNEHRRYGGNGECFLWRLDKVPNVVIGEKNEKQADDVDNWRFVGYPHTGLNEFTMYCTSEFLSMGAGDGHYGLWCDDRLLKGVSYPCLTYGNEPLSQEGKKFHITALEVWRVGS